jgi:uncharacterized Zn-finger protein
MSLFSRAKRKASFDNDYGTRPERDSDSPARSKKARFEDDESQSDYASTTAPTFSMTDGFSLAGTQTPLTGSSISRCKTKPREKRFACSWVGCGKVFDRPIRLQAHFNTHTGERPHVCPQDGCDKAFFKSSHLKAHISEKHNADRSYVCQFAVYAADGQLVACGRAFPTSTKLNRHVAQHEDREETTCDWAGCGQVFRKQETLQRHIKKDHLNELPYLCTHETKDGGACGQSFKTPGLLKGHVAQDHRARTYMCEICSAAGCRDPKQEDVAIANDLDEAFLPQPTSEQPSDVQQSGLGSMPGLPEDQRNESGNTTPVTFPTFADLQLHNRIVHPPTCVDCGKQCKSNKDLKAHIEIYHAPTIASTTDCQTKDLLCPINGCSRAVPGHGFTRKGNMDVHIKTVHAGEKAFVCGTHDLSTNPKVSGWNGIGCHLALGTKQALVAHIRTQHMGLDAATGVRTGLQKSDNSRKGRPRKAPIEQSASSIMDVDSMATSPERSATAKVSTAMAMLTGAGYETLRPIPCLVTGSQQCQMRFTRECDLAVHMELTHGWQVDDVNEALAGGAAALAAAAEPFPSTVDHMMSEAPMHEYEFVQVLDPQLAAI